MALAIFDLDNTLLTGDSDHLWGEFLCDRGIVDSDEYRRKNEMYYRQYEAGTLDIFEFLSFSLTPLTRHAIHDLHQWRAEFINTKIDPIISNKSRALLHQHRSQGDYLLIITATNFFVTEPIAERLGVDHLLATDPELVDGRYTGRVSGIPCFQGGKVERLNEWLRQTPHTLEDSHFYSDSHNDMPLLEAVTNPVAVDPDVKLATVAKQRGWEIISLRD
ncbi:MAG TPA: HAD-IB family hydrolase [Gammaproteobacteria bacterium]|nr:HAD-IB family hydrolase [Gammaproteobacteria bacterium]